MHLAFFNPQGNFDAHDSYWTAHPDFGGQLVYVKQAALALAARGHRVDIVTRLIDDPAWPEFSTAESSYPGVDNVRIIRIRCGPDDHFHRKEDLWPHIADWVGNVVDHYANDLPDRVTAHYGDGGVAAVLHQQATGVPFTFTAHSLGAQKLDKLGGGDLGELQATYHFAERLTAERLAMNRAATVITSTRQERDEQYRHRAYAGAVDPPDGFEVVPPGVNLEIFGSDRRSTFEESTRDYVGEQLAKHFGSRAHLPAVVASSRLDAKKNISGLVLGFATEASVHETANLVLLTGTLADPLTDPNGASPSEAAVLAEVKKLIEVHDLSGKVAAFGLQGQAALAATYRYLRERRSVFAVTSHYEPFGLAPLEAAAAGLPAVVTRNGGPSESLEDDRGQYGVLVDPADPADIGRGLLRALGEEWDTLAKAGEQRVLDRYTWDRTAEGYEMAMGRATGQPTDPLPMHPFFLGTGPAPDLADLEELYT